MAERFPEAVTVSVDDVQEASDWAETNLIGPVPEAGTIKARALLRAIQAYAVALALGLDVQVIRQAATAAATKRIKVGKIEIEKAQVDGSTAQVNLLASAEYWLERAELALQQAGTYPQRRLFPGTSR
ncbi:hypothetical protein BOO71_0000679 [Deinococcus marmoris]|uniref:Phage protein n=2 Tax=Deinococcus marmoris TaxID=249408 RepID=A0A1U7P4W7_9DEIO|nr:hypothetical protein BOO71_0000679 [Deinococcus marmoris]